LSCTILNHQAVPMTARIRHKPTQTEENTLATNGVFSHKKVTMPTTANINPEAANELQRIRHRRIRLTGGPRLAKKPTATSRGVCAATTLENADPEDSIFDWTASWSSKRVRKNLATKEIIAAKICKTRAPPRVELAIFSPRVEWFMSTGIILERSPSSRETKNVAMTVTNDKLSFQEFTKEFTAWIRAASSALSWSACVPRYEMTSEQDLNIDY